MEHAQSLVFLINWIIFRKNHSKENHPLRVGGYFLVKYRDRVGNRFGSFRINQARLHTGFLWRG